MTDRELVELLAGMPGVGALTASEANGAPQVAWGDRFFYYEPEGPRPEERKLPFATIVQNDYEGHDEFSQLHRPDVFRLNIGVGRDRFQELLGYPPAAHERHRDEFDYAALDRLLPHPVYAPQGWVAIVNPGEQTDELARTLLGEAHERARQSYERTHS